MGDHFQQQLPLSAVHRIFSTECQGLFPCTETEVRVSKYRRKTPYLAMFLGDMHYAAS